VTRSRREGKRR